MIEFEKVIVKCPYCEWNDETDVDFELEMGIAVDVDEMMWRADNRLLEHVEHVHPEKIDDFRREYGYD